MQSALPIMQFALLIMQFALLIMQFALLIMQFALQKGVNIDLVQGVNLVLEVNLVFQRLKAKSLFLTKLLLGLFLDAILILEATLIPNLPRTG